MRASTFSTRLETAGHLHVFLDSGQEFAISRHDTDVDGASGMVRIDSKRGEWTFPLSKVKYVDVEPSGPHD